MRTCLCLRASVLGAAPEPRAALQAPASKLIVALGNYGPQFDHTRSNLGFDVASRLLQHCKMPMREIHDPDDPYANRSCNRDPDGYDRVPGRYAGTNARKQFAVFMAGHRPASSWCTTPFVDYLGSWCDRLLLGDGTGADDSAPRGPARVALLQPHTQANYSGDSVGLVLKSQRQFRPSDIIIVCEDLESPFGSGRLSTVGNSEFIAHQGVANALDAIASHFDSMDCIQEVSVFQVGARSIAPARKAAGGQPTPGLAGHARTPEDQDDTIGGGEADEEGPHADFSLDDLTPKERRAVEARIAPIAAFALAIWATHPQKAESFVHRKMGLAVNPFELPSAGEMAVWQTLQRSMLTTRDEAVIASQLNPESRRPKGIQERYLRDEALKLQELLIRQNQKYP